MTAPLAPSDRRDPFVCPPETSVEDADRLRQAEFVPRDNVNRDAVMLALRERVYTLFALANEKNAKIAELEEMLGAALARTEDFALAAKDAEIAALTDALAARDATNKKEMAEIRSVVFRTKHLFDGLEVNRTAVNELAFRLNASGIANAPLVFL